MIIDDTFFQHLLCGNIISIKLNNRYEYIESEY